MPALPAELVCYVVDCLIPPDYPVAFTPSHVVTKTLHSMCLVSQGTYDTAMRHLYGHCVYLDSTERLERLLRTLESRARFSLSPDQLRRYRVSSMYLQPYPEEDIHDQVTAFYIRALFDIVSSSLERLVIDIPLRSVYSYEDYTAVRPILRGAFKKLTLIEEFTSIRDELYLKVFEFEDGIDEPCVWASWPRLKRLALYNPDLEDEEFRDGLDQLPELSHLVLVRADGLNEALRSVAERKRECKYIIVNTHGGHHDRESGEQDELADGSRKWKSLPNIIKVVVPTPPAFEDFEIDHRESSQDWVKEHAVERSLWKWTS